MRPCFPTLFFSFYFTFRPCRAPFLFDSLIIYLLLDIVNRYLYLF
nr:MAG TPA: hypothetical protein [Caudoviricetes sp.]